MKVREGDALLLLLLLLLAAELKEALAKLELDVVLGHAGQLRNDLDLLQKKKESGDEEEEEEKARRGEG